MLPGGTDPVGNQQNAPPGRMGILGPLPTSEVKIDSGWSGNGVYPQMDLNGEPKMAV